MGKFLRDNYIDLEKFKDFKDNYFRTNEMQNHLFYDNVYDQVTGKSSSHLCFNLLCYGVNLVGQKTALVVNDIDLYVDVLIPKMKKNMRDQYKNNENDKMYQRYRNQYFDIFKEIIYKHIKQFNDKCQAAKNGIIRYLLKIINI
jgi:hypothetical protein